MSNSQLNPNFFGGFIPGSIRSNGDTSISRQEIFDMPGGAERMVEIRVGEMQPDDQRAKQRAEFLEAVYPPSLTEGLEKDIARMTEQFRDYTHFDKQGNPVFRVQGKARQDLEMKIANRRNALVTARQERALAERVQAQVKSAKAAEEARINKAAQARAQEMIEEAEIERRARQIADRVAGVGR